MAEKGFKLFGTKIVMEAPQVRKVEEAAETTNSSSSGSSSGSGTGAAAAGEKPPSTTGLPCPRCKSRETKFCYFNNYNVNQPRHFCRGCHRYWTAGGAIRNVPVGAGRRKARPPLQGEEEEGGGSLLFQFSPALAGLEGAVVQQQWLISHDGFPAKRPNTGVLDRIR